MEEAAAGSGEEEVYCAVGKEQWNWKANLRWVLANFPGRRLVLAHVHRPPHRINMMGAWVPVSQVGAAMVAACRKWEEDEASEALDQLVRMCKIQRVHARKVIVSGDDLAGGLVQLVADHAVAELVMGAAADRAYSRKMRAPKSKKAATVQLKANPSCRIWYVCKGKLICTRYITFSMDVVPSIYPMMLIVDTYREASEEGLVSRGEPSTASTSPRPTASDCSTSASSSHRHGDGAAERLGIHDSTTPSQHHDSGDAGEMDDALAEKLKAEGTRRAPVAAVESVPVTDGDQAVGVLRFGLPELEEATGRFDESSRIGSAGIGRAGVYRGSLRGMNVAVRVISPDAAVGEARGWSEVVAASAGGWPLELATEVALLGLRCCAVSDGREPCRPAGELLEEALTVLKAAMDAAPGRTWTSSLLSSSETGASHGGGSECHQQQQRVHKVVDAAAQ
ncbi:unnamed protein product [Triticum turgidum subsp. durum]|uniref:RING-type E3 ubiquitin transferase n=1 Tax=Triticum turgidum subsp. durum TaxID=4567 RepID=A0A9R0ZR53_TRITD|nr:unnamed protein product [Triticum turgidum subsp. durum]